MSKLFVNKPKELTAEEFREVANVPGVAEMWGLDLKDPEDLEAWIGSLYAVKFDFTSGSPGYCGDVYLVQGDMLMGDAPGGGVLTLIRNDGKLDFAYENLRP